MARYVDDSDIPSTSRGWAPFNGLFQSINGIVTNNASEQSQDCAPLQEHLPILLPEQEVFPCSENNEMQFHNIPFEETFASYLQNSRQMSRTSESCVSVAPVVIDLTQDDCGSGSSSSSPIHDYDLSDILHAFDPQVSNREGVMLARQPENPYDSNAIRVNNVRGDQVGHLARDCAAALAPMMDAGDVRIDATVPFGDKNVFSMPVDLELYGATTDKLHILEELEKKGIHPLANRTEPEAAAGATSEEIGNAVYVAQNQENVKSQLDKLMEETLKLQGSEAMPGCAALATTLYPHQQLALAWMARRECSTELPPFWRKVAANRGGGFHNTLANFQVGAQEPPPSPVCGGILADDMGLGKTLTLLALILGNHRDGKALSLPVPGHTRGPEDGWRPNIAQGFGRASVSFAPNDLPTPKNSKKRCLKEDYESDEASLTDGSTTGDEDVETAARPSSSSSKPPAKRQRRAAAAAATASMNAALSLNDSVSHSEEEGENSVAAALDNTADASYKVGEDDAEEEAYTKPKSVPRKKSQPAKKSAVKSASNVSLSIGGSQLVVPADYIEEEAAKAAKKVHKPVAHMPLPPDVKVLPVANEVTPRDKQPRATLLVCPKSLVQHWVEQVSRHVLPNVPLKIFVHYEKDKAKSVQKLSDYDLVVTTFSTLSIDFGVNGPLTKMSWFRVVLDEGHTIRNPAAKWTKAAHNLRSERRWLLTGTPIQNSLQDLWSLICFLRVEPFNTEKSWFNRYISRPVKEGQSEGLSRLQILMRGIALRRTKQDEINGKPVVVLPEKVVVVRQLDFDDEEAQAYKLMQEQGRLQICRFFRENTLLKNYAHVFAILMRLRQMCCHPRLLNKQARLAALEGAESMMKKDEVDEEEKLRLVELLRQVLSSGGDEECAICLESLREPVITPCAHVYCRKCIVQVMQNGEEPGTCCPLCRAVIHTEAELTKVPDADSKGSNDDYEHRVMYAEDTEMANWVGSSKTDALLEELELMRNNTEKVVIVSQFTSFLTMIETPLINAGWKFCRFDGTMNMSERMEVLQRFDDLSPHAPRVLLLSLKAGGVGLNLVVASRMFVLDPAWNPAVEEQCYDRLHRLGQNREVRIVRFIMNDSIESRMQELQEQKKNLAQHAFAAGAKGAKQRQEQRVNDIKRLMQI